jgi:hypothetical protein
MAERERKDDPVKNQQRVPAQTIAQSEDEETVEFRFYSGSVTDQTTGIVRFVCAGRPGVLEERDRLRADHQ